MTSGPEVKKAVNMRENGDISRTIRDKEFDPLTNF